VLEPGAEAGNYVAETDYKRGARFKKLQRMLLSPLVGGWVGGYQGGTGT
jgi:hypothetical protein